ncbi:hypothetical protein D3C85_1417830 [compost metagenome]
MAGQVAGAQPAAIGERHAPFGAAGQVLEQEGHAPEGPVWQAAPGALAGLFELPRDHRVDGRIEAFDPRDGRVHQLQRGDFPLGDQRRLGGGIE